MILTETHPRSQAFLLLLASCWFGSAINAQQPPSAAAPATTPVTQPSAIMRPALDAVGEAMEVLHPERWKAAGSVRQEAAANIDSIRRDLEVTLPPLLAAADNQPGSVAQALPAYRNIEALYDVLLRVSETGRLSAPRDQATTLQNALAGLERSRRSLGEQMQLLAMAQDQRLHTLEAAARVAPHAVAATPAPCPPEPHTRRRRATKATSHSARKPTHSSTSQQTGTASH